MEAIGIKQGRSGPVGDRAADVGLRSRLLFAASWSLLGALVSRGLLLLGTVGSARLLGAAEFGKLGLVQSTSGLFAAVAGLGLGVTATRFVARWRDADPARAGRYIGLFLRANLASGLVLSAAYLVAASLFGAALPDGGGLTAEFRAAVGMIFFGALNGTGMGILSGLEAFRTSAAVGVLRGLLATAALLLGAAWGGVLGGVAGMVAAEAATTLLIGATIRARARGHHIAVSTPPWREFWPVFGRFGLPVLISNVTILPVLWWTNALLVWRSGDYGELGLYAAALKWNQLILFVPSTIAAVVLPMLSNRHGAGDAASFRRLLRLSLAVNALAALVPAVPLAAFPGWFMGLYGDGYERGAATLVVLSAAALPMVVNNVLGQSLVGAGLMGRRLALDLVLASCLMLGSWCLVPRFGAWGLGLANALAYSASCLGLAVLSCGRAKEFDPCTR